MFTLSKLSVPRDRVRASFSESQDWETEEDGVSMDFDMTLPLQGSRLKLKRLFLNWKCEILKLFWEPLFVLVPKGYIHTIWPMFETWQVLS